MNKKKKKKSPKWPNDQISLPTPYRTISSRRRRINAPGIRSTPFRCYLDSIIGNNSHAHLLGSASTPSQSATCPSPMVLGSSLQSLGNSQGPRDPVPCHRKKHAWGLARGRGRRRDSGVPPKGAQPRNRLGLNRLREDRTSGYNIKCLKIIHLEFSIAT